MMVLQHAQAYMCCSWERLPGHENSALTAAAAGGGGGGVLQVAPDWRKQTDRLKDFGYYDPLYVS
jgi:hypothetical protein